MTGVIWPRGPGGAQLAPGPPARPTGRELPDLAYRVLRGPPSRTLPICLHVPPSPTPLSVWDWSSTTICLPLLPPPHANRSTEHGVPLLVLLLVVVVLRRGQAAQNQTSPSHGVSCSSSHIFTTSTSSRPLELPLTDGHCGEEAGEFRCAFPEFTVPRSMPGCIGRRPEAIPPELGHPEPSIQSKVTSTP